CETGRPCGPPPYDSRQHSPAPGKGAGSVRTMPNAPSIVSLLLLLGLGFFFGLAFEEFHARAGQKRPGGVRSFPLLALAGALLHPRPTRRAAAARRRGH